MGSIRRELLVGRPHPTLDFYLNWTVDAYPMHGHLLDLNEEVTAMPLPLRIMTAFTLIRDPVHKAATFIVCPEVHPQSRSWLSVVKASVLHETTQNRACNVFQMTVGHSEVAFTAVISSRLDSEYLLR
jgi:hypothetical protein